MEPSLLGANPWFPGESGLCQVTTQTQHRPNRALNVRKESLARLAGFLMPLRENLIELKDKKLIACRQCRTVADVSMNNSLVKLVCPKCRAILGSWPTASEAAADMSAFVASTEQQH